jgi:hypothetical protein
MVLMLLGDHVRQGDNGRCRKRKVAGSGAANAGGGRAPPKIFRRPRLSPVSIVFRAWAPHAMLLVQYSLAAKWR